MYNYTTKAQVRAAFWIAAETGEFEGFNVTRKRITHYSGNWRMHNADTRCCFVDFVDTLARNGDISYDLAQEVTL